MDPQSRTQSGKETYQTEESDSATEKAEMEKVLVALRAENNALKIKNRNLESQVHDLQSRLVEHETKAPAWRAIICEVERNMAQTQKVIQAAKIFDPSLSEVIRGSDGKSVEGILGPGLNVPS
ncbi:hypothetical protein HDV00_005479 [Rhizophlyctis rosea]|nr:hypothetical protein HDV00_005479 [Rhizophlyctis rosea]